MTESSNSQELLDGRVVKAPRGEGTLDGREAKSAGGAEVDDAPLPQHTSALWFRQERPLRRAGHV